MCHVSPRRTYFLIVLPDERLANAKKWTGCLSGEAIYDLFCERQPDLVNFNLDDDVDVTTVKTIHEIEEEEDREDEFCSGATRSNCTTHFSCTTKPDVGSRHRDGEFGHDTRRL